MANEWGIKNLYFYLVSFVALILIIIGAVNLTQTAIAYITPVYDDYSPFERSGPYQDLSEWEEVFGPAVIEQEIDRYETINRENYQRSLTRDLVGGMAYIAIALPVYLYHWRRIPKLEEDI